MTEPRTPFHNSPRMAVDMDSLLYVPTRLTCVCSADIHPRGMSRFFRSEVPSHCCHHCKKEIMRRLAKKQGEGINHPAERNIDAIAEGGKGFTHITTRRKQRGE